MPWRPGSCRHPREACGGVPVRACWSRHACMQQWAAAEGHTSATDDSHHPPGLHGEGEAAQHGRQRLRVRHLHPAEVDAPPLRPQRGRRLYPPSPFPPPSPSRPSPHGAATATVILLELGLRRDVGVLQNALRRDHLRHRRRARRRVPAHQLLHAPRARTRRNMRCLAGMQPPSALCRGRPSRRARVGGSACRGQRGAFRGLTAFSTHCQ